MKYLPVAALTSIILLSTVLSAQTSRGPIQKNSKRTQTADAETQQRRSTAISLLQSLAIEARSFRDEALRARVQARIADVLWDHDRDAARALFRRAWEIAEAFDRSSSTSANLPGRVSKNRPTQIGANLRREVLQLASRRDHVLGEEFLSKLTPRNPDQPPKTTANFSPYEIAERMRLASQFLESGNLERALQFADPALIEINQRTIQFLVALRDKNAAAADQRFASLLSLAGSDPASDANTVSLLTSYAFTPWIYLIVSPTGIPSSNSYDRHPAPDLAAGLQRKFFETAARILLRPLQQVDQSSAGRAGTFFIATRLLPLFQRSAPDLVAPINAQLAAMGPEAASVTTNASALSLNRGMNEDGARTPIDEELKERLDRARDADARDRAYAFAAMSAADRADPRAREFADKIEDTDTRKGIGTFVDYSYIGSLLRKKEPAEALRIIRKSDLPHTLRAHFLTQAAALTSKDDSVRSMELFDEALAEARRIDAGTAERAYCLLAILREFSKLDRTRTWELLSETVKAANSVADFTGEDGHTSVRLEGKFSIQLGTQLASPADLSEVFGRLAEEGFYQAIDASKTFTGDAPRALVTIAIAKAVLTADER